MITDLTPYREYFDDCDMTEQEKLDFLNVLAGIVQNIVDRNLGIYQPGFIENKDAKSIENLRETSKLGMEPKVPGCRNP